MPISNAIPLLFRRGWLWFGLLLLLAGCASMVTGEGSPPTRYYLLSSMAEHKRGNVPHKVRLALEPVELPDYLTRPQIVYRQGDHRLAMEESDLWAETLDAGLARVMVDNLSILLDSDQIWSLPVKRTQPPEMRLWVRMLRFEVDAGGRASLAARWKLQGREGQEFMNAALTELQGHQIDVRDKDAQVAALSSILEEFCRQVAARVVRNMGESRRAPPGDR
ncbi:MAG: membrane integrity-associated transporter subunit PqiC [Magnetococcales bacterium]|nr:membrane integrity-associated transporter subunit PqiC [Magnetococcales bacterium]